jgi:hypothetical protein
VFVVTDEYKPVPTNGDINTRIVGDMKRKMSGYIPGLDYILTGGSPISIILVGMTLARGVEHRVLKWNNQTNKYDLCLVKV